MLIGRKLVQLPLPPIPAQVLRITLDLTPVSLAEVPRSNQLKNRKIIHPRPYANDGLLRVSRVEALAWGHVVRACFHLSS